MNFPEALVATAVMATVHRYGGQSAFMVPTEVLARQHAENVSRLLLTLHDYLQKQGRGSDFRLTNVALLTGSVPASESLTTMCLSKSGSSLLVSTFLKPLLPVF